MEFDKLYFAIQLTVFAVTLCLQARPQVMKRIQQSRRGQNTVWMKQFDKNGNQPSERSLSCECWLTSNTFISAEKRASYSSTTSRPQRAMSSLQSVVLGVLCHHGALHLVSASKQRTQCINQPTRVLDNKQ
jgi:hypothetical protein